MIDFKELLEKFPSDGLDNLGEKMSKKIMFSDKYGLTDAVLNGTKTMTRRVIPQKILDKCIVSGEAMLHAPFQVGEIVAIAQPYSEVLEVMIQKHGGYGEEQNDFYELWNNTPPWQNKMFVRADLMPHHIRITDIKVERLQEISDADCLREGIKCFPSDVMPDLYTFDGVSINWKEPKEAFATLIDKVGKKGNWDKNPWVYVYEFELVD